MNHTPIKAAFSFAVILHLGLFFAFCFSKTVKPPKVIPFTLVTSAPSLEDKTAVLPATPEPAITPSATVAKASPPPPSKAAPKPKPEPKKEVAKAAPKPAAEKSVVEIPQKKMVSYDDFVKQRGKPKEPPPQTVAKKKIDWKPHLPKLTLAASSLDSTVSQVELESYGSQIKGLIHESWERCCRPNDSLIGYNRPAQLTLVLTQDGSVLEYDLQTSSGAGDFDKSILEAIAQFGRFPQPPTKSKVSFTLTFSNPHLDKLF